MIPSEEEAGSRRLRSDETSWLWMIDEVRGGMQDRLVLTIGLWGWYEFRRDLRTGIEYVFK